MKILVVEDSASMRSYLASIIESGTNDRDLEIVEAATGFEALKTLPHHKFILFFRRAARRDRRHGHKLGE